MPLLLLPNGATYSWDEVEAALCVWEELDRRTRPPEHLQNLGLLHWRWTHGTSEMRTAAIGLARYVDEMYQLLSTTEWEPLAFDWEIIPAILDTVVWSSSGPAPTLPANRKSAMQILDRLTAKEYR